MVETHVSLFDGTNCGIALKDRPVFSVQHHPEASPGPTDSLYLFQRFADLTRGKIANLFITRPMPSIAYLPYAYGTSMIETVILNGKVC